ncbi:MAG TPA: tripartite tricarboxylate transporter substrate binding protein, partial [Ramlibacter sp.]|nr:tripartite tricarboxylate transporter substrate binding protein [Ramlibacter sp.]
MTHFTRRAALALAAAAALGAAAPALSQAWPDKPMRIMVGASPGGGTDILAR